MKHGFLIRIASVFAMSAMSLQPIHGAEKARKEPKIKLDTLKPGKIKLDPRLGYVLVRLGPKAIGKNPAVSVGFSRIDPTTDTFFKFDSPKDVPASFFRSSAVAVNVGRSFGEVDGTGIYLVGFYPGRWIIGNVGSTCLSLGSYSFDVKQGEVTDIGTLLAAREDGQVSSPEFNDAKLSPDLVEFGTLMNIVMSEALYVKPASDAPTLPKELSAMPVTKAALTPDRRFGNTCMSLINRAASLPPIEHQKPMTREEAIAELARMNPPERVEAARKKAERERATANSSARK